MSIAIDTIDNAIERTIELSRLPLLEATPEIHDDLSFGIGIKLKIIKDIRHEIVVAEMKELERLKKLTKSDEYL